MIFHLYYLFLALAILFLALLIVIALRPNTMIVSRSALFSAPPERVFALVNDFHNWEQWSPWAKMDPHSILTFEGAAAGQGAIFTWKGNKKVGEGRMTITNSMPPERIQLQLQFIKPFPNTATTVFTFEPVANQTKITWTMTGKNNFLGKAFCMLMNMDKMIGGDFDRGLAAMKIAAEK